MSTLREGFKLANNLFELFTQNVWEQIEAERQEAIKDMGKCRDALLKDDFTTVQLLCDAFVRELPCYVTVSQRTELEQCKVEGIDKWDVLAFYCAGREGVYKHKKIELLMRLEKDNE